MEFNFYDRYKDYSATQLLDMLKNPQNYQPAAVEAVNRIITERGITEEDLQQVDVMQETQEEIVPDGKQDLLPEHWEETKPPKWVTIVLIVVALEFAWSFFTTFYGFYKVFSAGFFRIQYLAYFLSLTYIPITSYLLLKRNFWGWILLFTGSLFSLVTYIGAVLSITWYGNFYMGQLYGPLWWIVFNAGLLFCLWKPAMHFYFGIAAPIKKRTFVIGLGLSLLFLLIVVLIIPYLLNS
jgi:hypothetical protein